MGMPDKIMVAEDSFGFLHAYSVENHPTNCTKYIRSDLAELDWKDMEELEDIILEVRNEFWAADRKHSAGVKEEMYREVLDRFKDYKKEGRI